MQVSQPALKLLVVNYQPLYYSLLYFKCKLKQLVNISVNLFVLLFI